MLSYLLIVLLAFILWALYSSVYKPYTQYKSYMTAFEHHHYKVLNLGFVPFFSQLFFDTMKGTK